MNIGILNVGILNPFHTEILEVLNDWWGTSLYQMTRSQAVEALAKALSHPNVGCNVLASKLSTRVKVPRAKASHATQSTSTTSGAKKLHSRPSSVEPSVTPSARLSRLPPELSGTILKDKTFQFILGLSSEERWKRLGRRLHVLHRHLQTHLQQELKEYLQSIDRL